MGWGIGMQMAPALQASLQFPGVVGSAWEQGSGVSLEEGWASHASNTLLLQVGRLRQGPSITPLPLHLHWTPCARGTNGQWGFHGEGLGAGPEWALLCQCCPMRSAAFFRGLVPMQGP